MDINSFLNNKGFKARFLSTLLINILRICLSFIGGIIIARNFGPAGFGDYSFLLGSFNSIITLLDMGTSSAFYTFLSQKKQSQKFYLYYFSWIGIQFAITLLLINFIFPKVWINKIWLGHPKEIIILAFLASFMMNKVWEAVTHVGESIRATLIVQVHNIIIAVLYLIIVFAMALSHNINIQNLFIAILFAYFLLSIILANKLKRDMVTVEEVKLTDMVDKFKSYCAPLIIFSIATFAYSFADVWLLQRFGGPAQQGFYSIGLRFSAMCLVVTASILKVFWKEIAEANMLGNKERLYYLYTRISRIFCFFSTAGACFLIPFSREILLFLLGPKYEIGWPCLAVMLLFPIHQSLAQINGTYFYATTHTKLRSNIGIISMMASIPITYFILAPSSTRIPGLGLGSIGLALKMVILQIIGVNVSTYFICKPLKWKLDFIYQFKCIVICLAASYVIKEFLNLLFHILNASLHSVIFMMLCMPVYSAVIVFIIYFFPEFGGLEKKDVLKIFKVFDKENTR